MTKTYFKSFNSNYLRPSYPIKAGSPRPLRQTLASYAAGLASLIRTADSRAAQPTFADGFAAAIALLVDEGAVELQGARP